MKAVGLMATRDEGHSRVGEVIKFCLLPYRRETKSRRGDGECGRLYERVGGAWEGHDSRGTHGHSLHQVTAM